MRNLTLLLFTSLTISLNAQQSEKYTTQVKGRITVLNDLSPNIVTWTITNHIINNVDTSRFFFLPVSKFYDISVTGMGSNSNGIYGMCITSKDDLIKFAEGLIYLGKQKGRKSEKLVINKQSKVELSILGTLPKFVMIGNTGSFYISKSNAIKLGNTILKNIIYF